MTEVDNDSTSQVHMFFSYLHTFVPAFKLSIVTLLC